MPLTSHSTAVFVCGESGHKNETLETSSPYFCNRISNITFATMASARTFAKSAPSSRLGMSDTGAAVEKIANVSSSAAKSKLELDKTKKLLGVQQQPAVKVSSSAAKSKLELDKTKKLQQPAVKQQVNYTVNRPSRSDKLNMAHTKTANHDKKVADKRKQGVALHDKTVSQNVDRRASAKPIQLEKKHQAARSKHE